MARLFALFILLGFASLSRAHADNVDACLRYEDLARTAASDTFAMVFSPDECDGRELLETYIRAIALMPPVDLRNAYLRECYERRYRLTMLQHFIGAYLPCLVNGTPHVP